MQTFEIRQKILLLNTESKEKVNVYTFVDLESKQTQTVVGIKEDVPLHKPLIAIVSVKINKESVELQDGTRRYFNNTNLFIIDLKLDK